MKESTRNILVGLTAVVATMGLATILMLFGYVPRWLQRGYEVRVELNHASGLTPNSQVKLSGMDIGSVRTVRLQEPPRRGVVVTVLINRGVAVARAAKVSVEAPIIGGSPALALEIDDLDDRQLHDLLPTDGSALLRGRVPSLASQFAAELKAAFSEPFEQIQQLSSQWTQVAANLNTLIAPRTIEQADTGQAEGNISTVVARADARLKELGQTIDRINSWLGDDQLQADVRAAAANARKLLDQLDRGATRFNKLAEDTAKHLQRLTDRYLAVADDLSGAIRSARELVDKAGQGQGTVGKLLNDPALYNNLNDAFERINEAVKEMRLLLEKWKKEGVPLQL